MIEEADKQDGESRNVQKDFTHYFKSLIFSFFLNVQGESRTLTIFKIIAL